MLIDPLVSDVPVDWGLHAPNKEETEWFALQLGKNGRNHTLTHEFHFSQYHDTSLNENVLRLDRKLSESGSYCSKYHLKTLDAFHPCDHGVPDSDHHDNYYTRTLKCCKASILHALVRHCMLILYLSSNEGIVIRNIWKCAVHITFPPCRCVIYLSKVSKKILGMLSEVKAYNLCWKDINNHFNLNITGLFLRTCISVAIVTLTSSPSYDSVQWVMPAWKISNSPTWFS